MDSLSGVSFVQIRALSGSRILARGAQATAALGRCQETGVRPMGRKLQADIVVSGDPQSTGGGSTLA
jgi:hypothetical protein